MSHQDVARVTMRMLYDPAFARAVCAGEAPLPELSEQERGWLADVDEAAAESRLVQDELHVPATGGPRPKSMCQ